MKQIKLFSLAALLMAGAAFTACSSDNDIIDEQQNVNTTGKYTKTINASKGDGATTRALTLNDHTLNATWATTENVYVQKGSEWATGSLQPQEDGVSTTLKGELSGITINANDELTLQFPKSGAISYAGQLGTLADIAANFDYATATVEVASVSATGNIIPKAATTTFTNLQAIVKFTLIDKADGTTPLSATQLVVNDGTNDYTITPTSGTSEIYVAIPGISGQTVTLTATVGDDTYTYEKSGVTFTNGQYYEITVKMTKQAPAPAGPVGAIFPFSVSATQQVYFSPGNLRYKYDEGWSFTEPQYDFIDYYDNWDTQDWVDLFGWGTWGSGKDPLSESTTSSSYTWSTDFQGTLDGHDDWRTLTYYEWVWLLGPDSPNPGTNCRTNATNLRKFRTVNGVYGLVIMPDGFDYSTTSLDSDWNVLETAGAVFLPAAGIRNGTRVTGVGSDFNYWSSTPQLNNNPSGAMVVYNDDEDEDGVDEVIIDRNGRSQGSSVRLVRPAEPAE